MYPGRITRIVVRPVPQNVLLADVAAGVNRYPFDPTVGPGYVRQCHILGHEDNEMMRHCAVEKIGGKKKKHEET
jgi:spore coat protein A, manganese oxidase